MRENARHAPKSRQHSDRLSGVPRNRIYVGITDDALALLDELTGNEPLYSVIERAIAEFVANERVRRVGAPRRHPFLRRRLWKEPHSTAAIDLGASLE